MATPRRRLVRPAPATPKPAAQPQRQLDKLRARLESERVAFTRWLARLRRAFHAMERRQQCIARIERHIRKLEGT